MPGLPTGPREGLGPWQRGTILTQKGAFKANFPPLNFPALERTVDPGIPLGQQQRGKFGSTLLLQPKDWSWFS